MTFNDMVKSIRNRNNNVAKMVYKDYPEFAEEYVLRDIENGDLSVASRPQDALLDYENIYNYDTGEVESIYLVPGYDEADKSEIQLNNGKIIDSLEIGRRRKIELNDIKGIIAWSDGYLSIYGDVRLSVNEDDLMEQIFGEDKVAFDDVNVIYEPSFL